MKLLFYKLVRPLIKFLTFILFRPKYIGRENIPKNGKFIFAGNHTYGLDCVLLISSTRRVVRFFAKKELLQGFKGWIFKAMGIIPVNRSIHDKTSLLKGKEVLKNNGVIGIFPEGTINWTKKTILPFKIGAVKMSHDIKAPIVPFVIKGKYKVFNNNLSIEFLKPYVVKKDDLDVENDKLMNIIKKGLETNYD